MSPELFQSTEHGSLLYVALIAPTGDFAVDKVQPKHTLSYCKVTPRPFFIEAHQKKTHAHILFVHVCARACVCVCVD